MNYLFNKTTKFETLSLVENGLILKTGKKDIREIPFSELDKVYIKSSSLDPIFQIVCIVFPFVLIYLFIQRFSIGVVLFFAFFVMLPFFVKMYNYKWYRLIILLKDGTFYRKKGIFKSKNREHQYFIQC